MSRQVGLAVILAGLAATACAPAVQPDIAPTPSQLASGTPRQCFAASSVTGYHDVDRQTVDLTVGASRVFRVELFGSCPDVRDVVNVGVRTRGGSSFVCDDQDVELVVPGPFGTQVCRAVSIRARTPAEIAADSQAGR